MARKNSYPRKLLITIKNKWTNNKRVVALDNFSDVQSAHKYAYYKYTSNLEDIVLITDNKNQKLFTLKTGFSR